MVIGPDADPWPKPAVHTIAETTARPADLSSNLPVFNIIAICVRPSFPARAQILQADPHRFAAYYYTRPCFHSLPRLFLQQRERFPAPPRESPRGTARRRRTGPSGENSSGASPSTERRRGPMSRLSSAAGWVAAMALRPPVPLTIGRFPCLRRGIRQFHAAPAAVWNGACRHADGGAKGPYLLAVASAGLIAGRNTARRPMAGRKAQTR